MKKSKLTKKNVEDLYITTNIEIVEDAAADGNVYCHFINVKYYPDENSDNLETLASATIYVFQDYEFNMRDDADKISGDLVWVMNSLIDKFNVKSYDKVCILDSFDFFNADVTAGARVYLLKSKVMPYLQDIGVKWVGFCNAAVLFTDKASEQNSIDKKLESFPGILPFVDKGTNWKDTVRCVNSTLFRYHELDDEIANEDYLKLKLYEEENNLKLPDNFEDLYYAYFSNEAQMYTQEELTLIKQVYKFRKSMYYRRTNEEFIMTSETKKVMEDTRKIIDTFNNIDDMFDSCEKSAAAYMESAMHRNLSNQADNLISLFVSNMKRFIDYLEQQWLPHYLPEYKKIWKKQFCSFVYDHNLGYRLCYNLRDFDQHLMDIMENHCLMR